ncbi:DNA polymerase subunit beta [Ignicoccus pacificus DSM 13166]|uniref:protein adenylyltransferase n=1 Tax=Ignicoccus pacificus DSM 13166 TaxID=940294 RepID=A0A977K944_9CREN|nr:DNA polymerase subunit beta [Ignicoccus pacificus DSM 13166]
MLIVYDKRRWEILKRKREKAISIMKKLAQFSPVVHGSVARGDVNEESDIDIAITFPVSPLSVEVALGSFSHGYIIQATPASTPKVYLALDYKEEVMVSFPLAKLSPREFEFYAFGGQLDLNGLLQGKRVPGVDKRLFLILPRDEGHWEESIIGKEGEVAKLLGISQETVEERVRLLSRRREKGRTGVFIKIKFYGSVEEALHNALRKNRALKMSLLERGVI